MRKMYNLLRLVAVMLVALSTATDIYGQCGTTPDISATYCPGQGAKMVVTDSDPNTKYKWLLSKTDLTGNYGTDGKGRNYISPNSQTGPANFMYVREIATSIGPGYTPNIGGTGILNDGVNTYKMPFTSVRNFKINTVSVIVRLDKPAVKYGFNVRYVSGTDTTYSKWFTASPSALTSLGSNFYKVDIPVDFIITKKGTGSLEFISTKDPGGAYEAAEAFYWWGGTEYNGANYAGSDIKFTEPEKVISTVTRTPLIMDWKITLQCDTATVLSKLATACCTPVGNNFTLTSQKANPVASDFPLPLTASGTDINSLMYYYWYDVNGKVVAKGPGVNQYSAPELGQYSVRVVNKETDIDNFACYTSRTISLQKKSIFAPKDTTVCLGTPLSFTGQGAEGKYGWTSLDPVAKAAIVTPDSQSTDIRLMKEGIYTFELSGEVKLGNIATDGKFENFNKAINLDPAQVGRTFETKYTIAAGGGTNVNNNGQYRVDNFIRAYDNSTHCQTVPAYWTKTDPITKDVTSRGNIFYADANSTGSGDPGTAQFALNNYLWQLSNQPVEPNKTYTFTMDISNWNNDAKTAPPFIMLLVNGTPLKNLKVNGIDITEAGTPGNEYYKFPENLICEWQTLSAEWSSGTNTTATITVAEVGKIDKGHEFAMDDITFFTSRGLQTDDVIVTVKNCNELEARADAEVCIGKPFDLSLVKNNGFFSSWKNSKGEILATTETSTVYPTTNETYTATAKFPVIGFLKNGNFEEDRPIDFYTNLKVPTGQDINQGDYFIGTGSNTLVHEQSMLINQPDHTKKTTAGRMYIGRPDFGQNLYTVFRKSISVKTGEEYGFSFWLRHLHLVNANAVDFTFDIMVTGQPVKTITLPKLSDWTFYDYSWKAPASGNVTVEIRFTTNHFETGFAIDDISLAQLGSEKSDDVKVTTKICNTLTLKDEGCKGNERLISYKTDAVFAGWYDPTGKFISLADTLKVIPGKKEAYSAAASIALGDKNVNGNMEAGNLTGMTAPAGTDRTGSNQDFVYDTYAFVTNSSVFAKYPSQTAPGGSGKYLMVNSKAAASQTIYKSGPIAVKTGETYNVSLNLAHIATPEIFAYFTQLYPVKVLVGGVSVGEVTLPKNTTWQNINLPYTATATGNVSIELVLVNKETQSLTVPPWNIQDKQYLAHGIDNVKLSETKKALSATIEVDPCVTCTPPKDLAVQVKGKDTITSCDGTARLLKGAFTGTASVAYKYTWYKTGGTAKATASAYSDLNLTGAVADSGWYWLAIEDGATGIAKCIAYDSVFVNIDGKVTPGAIAADQILCSGDKPKAFTSTTKAGGGNFTSYKYTWQYSDDNAANWKAAGSTAETYTESVALTTTRRYRRRAASGVCKDSVTTPITVTVNPVPTKPTITIDPNKTSFCDGDLHKLTAASTVASGTITYTWYGAATGTSDKVDGKTTAGEYTYKVTAKANNCTSDTSLKTTIKVNTLPTAKITGNDTTICKAGKATINVSLTGKASWKVSYTGPDGVDSINSASSPLAIPFTKDGTYTITKVKDGNGCTNTATGSKKVSTTPDLVVGIPQATCDFNTKKFTAVFDISGGDGNYKVNPAGTITSGGTYTSPAVLSVDNSLHTFKVSDGSNCPANIDIPVDVKRDCSCPVSGKLTSTAMSICKDSSYVNFELELSGALSPPYKGEITAPDNSKITFDGLSAGKHSLKITKLLTGTYTLSKVADESPCEGGTSGNVKLTVNELPEAKISGGGTICKENDARIAFDLLKGTAPWTINYTDPAGAKQTISSSKSSDTLKTKIDGKYTITGVKDANQCSNTATGNVDVKTTPDLVISGQDSTCNYSTGDLKAVFKISGGDGFYKVKNISEVSAGTINAAGDFTSNLIVSKDAQKHLFYVSDNSGCKANTKVEVPVVKNCSCPVKGELKIEAPSVCADETDIDVTLDLSGAIALPYYAEITAPDGTELKFPGLVAGTNTLNITNLQKGVYKLTKSADASVCIGSSTGSVDLTINPLPTAVVSGDTAICNKPGAFANVNVKLTGTAPFDLTIEGSTSGSKPVNGINKYTYTLPTSVTENYKVTALKDANKCIATSMIGSAEVTHLEDPKVIDTNIICDSHNPTNGAPGKYQYYIEVTLSGGDAATYKEVSGLKDSLRVGNKWTSKMIDEKDPATNLTFTDQWTCNPVQIAGLYKRCSCPEFAEIKVTGAPAVCEQGTLLTSELTVNLKDGGNTVTNWNFAVYDKDNKIVQGHNYTSTPYTGGNTLTISGVGAGEYFVKNVHGTCDGKDAVPAKITYLPSPVSEISGDTTICDDGLAEAKVKLKITNGTAPFNATYTVDGANPTVLAGIPANHTYQTMDFGIHQLSIVEDKNTCTSKPADRKGKAIIKGNALPTTADAGSDESICPDNYTLAANDTTSGVGVGKWLAVPGITFDNINKPDAKISGIAEGKKVKLIWTIKNGVCPISKDSVEIFRPGVTEPLAGKDTSICVNNLLKLAANAVKSTETGTWTTTSAGIIFNPDAENPAASVSNLPVGVYKFAWTIENSIPGCFKSDTMIAEVITLPDAATIPQGDLLVCEGTKGEVFTIPAVKFASEYIWTISTGDAVIRPGKTRSATIDFGSVKSTIVVTPKNQCGTGTPASTDVAISPDLTPSVSVGALKTLICEGDQTTIYIKDTANAGTPEYRWYVNGIPVQTNGDSLIYKFERSAKVHVEMFTSEACVDSTVLNDRGAVESNDLPVIAEQIPVADAGSDVYIMQGEVAHLFAKGGVTYSWTPAVSVVDSVTTNQSLNVSPRGPVQFYTVTAYSTSGICHSEDEVKVTVEKPVKPWNSFSPNGDGSYDFWPIDNINEYPNALIEVYNRWGNLVWKSTGYSKAWDGTNFRNGDPLPVATYYYIIHPNGGKLKTPITGDVTIVK